MCGVPAVSKRTACAGQVRAWPYTLYAIYTNHFEPISTPLLLGTHLRYRAEIIHI